MSIKSFEIVLRDLQNTIQTLVNKVSDLESQTNKQNIVIAKQTEAISELKKNYPSATRTSIISEITEAGKAPLVERPKRQAHINAAAALTTKKNCAVGAPSSAEPTKSNEKNRTIETGASRSTPIMTTATIAPKSVTRSPKDCTIDPASRLNDDTTPWSVVNKKPRKGKSGKVSKGAGTESPELKTVEKLRFLQAWSFSPETTSENILNHLRKIKDSNDYSVKKREIKTTRHAAFVIGVPESLFELLAQPMQWPAGVCFTEWFLMRPRTPRGGPATISQ